MKGKLVNFLTKRTAAVMFALTLFLFGLFAWSMNEETAYAADYTAWDATTNDDFAVATYSASVAKTYVRKKAPTAEGYLFAGWFKDAACTEANVIMTADDITGTCYAKFVPEDVMSIKVQITNGDANSATAEVEKNMRFVSSVDTQTYLTVGFRMKYLDDNQNWTYKINKGTLVYERIVSATAGDEFKFSPKVVDTKSEYFMTATWKGEDNTGIAEADFDTNYYVRAFWTTFDGVRVYGPTRYVSVNDGLNKNIVNVSVKDTAKALDSQSLTASYVNRQGTAKTATAVELFHDGTYAHLKLDLGSGVNHTSTLSSATKFTISNGASNVDTIYRNLYTTHATTTTTANADSTWHSVYNAADSSRKEFVIATSADLYGFAELVNTTGNKCKGLTVYMVSDIVANIGSASVSGWVPSTGQTGYVWTPINGFAGTFDGQRHTLKGINAQPVSGITGVGLFTGVAGATIQDFTITNSYTYVNTTAGTGAIAGTGYGTFKNIHTDVKYQDNGKGVIGGLVGIVTGNSTFNNCWNKSPITSSAIYAGGMFATVSNTGYTINVQHCLNSGNLTYSGKDNSYFGGLFGRANTAQGSTGKVTVTDCLNVGVVRGTGGVQTYMGGLAGFGANPSYATGTAVFKNSYTATTYSSTGTSILGVTTLVGAYDAGVTFTGVTNDSTVIREGLISELAYVNTSLDFESTSNLDGYWICRENDTPMLKTFSGDSDTVKDVSKVSKNEFHLVNGFGFIWNKAQLDSFATKMQDSTFASQVNSNTKVYLMANITYNSGDRDTWVAGTATAANVWTPIEGYSGTFEGQGHTIGGLYGKTVSGIAGYGLFTGTTATTVIKDLSVVNGYFIATTNAGTGGLIGRGAGKIENVLTDVVITDTSAKGSFGGIVGSVAGDLSIENCYSKCNISTYGQNAGGILGYTTNATGGFNISIINCLNSGSIMRADTGDRNLYFGGIVGRVASSSSANWSGCTLTVKYCLNVGMVDASNGYYGGILGYASGKKADGTKSTIINNCYSKQFFNATTGAESGATEIVGAWGADKSQPDCAMIDADNLTSAVHACTYANLKYWSSENTSGAWVLRDGKTPTLKYYVGTDAYLDPVAQGWTDFALSSNGNGTINNLYQLKSFAEQQNAGTLGATSSSTILLGANIVVSNGNRNDWAAGKFVTNQTWTPIVNFPGTFNGQGNTIAGLYITRGSATGTGLFNATTTTAQIQKLYIKNAYVLAGNNSGTGAVIGKGAGLVWEVYADAIIDGNGTNGKLGGIVGEATGNLKIKSCWNLSDITAYNIVNGGILGNASNYVVDVEYCLNTGDLTIGPNTAVTGANAQSGGIVGKAGAGKSGAYTGTINVTCCLNMGHVKSNHATMVNQLGGVAGYITGTNASGAYTVKITNSYSALTYDSYNQFNNIKTLVGVDYGKGGGITSSECIDYDLTIGQFAYYFMPLNYYSTSTTGGYWHAREGSHPIPEPFGTASGYTLISKFDVATTAMAPATFYETYSYSGGGTQRKYTDIGAGMTVQIPNTNATQYEAYVTKLLNNGMLQYGEQKTIASADSSYGVNRFNTFVGRGNNVYVAYFATTKTTRVAVIPKTEEVLLGLRAVKLNTATDTVQPSVTQMQLESAGMMYVAQLADGKYVIVDGGNSGSITTDEYDKERLYQFMVQHKPSSMAKPVIAGWIFTHPDADHIKLANSFMYYYRNVIEIESFAYNFAEEFVCDEDGNATQDAATDSSNYNSIKTMKNYSTTHYPNAPHYNFHSGQSLSFKGMSIEILQTEEDYSRAAAESSTWNYTSSAFKFKFSGGGTALFVGDYNESNCNHLAEIYGSYLQSDILQLPHHGLYGTTKTFATKVAPTVVFASSLQATLNSYHTTTFDWYTYLKSGSRTWYTNDKVGRVLINSDGTVNPRPAVTMTISASDIPSGLK